MQAKWLLAATVASSLLCSHVYAKSTINDCGSHPEDTNDDWLKCEASFINKDRSHLQDAERRLIHELPAKSQIDFVNEEDAWNLYAKKACQFYFNGDWGRDGQVVHGPLCVDETIVQRTHELQSLARWLGHYEQKQ